MFTQVFTFCAVYIQSRNISHGGIYTILYTIKNMTYQEEISEIIQKQLVDKDEIFNYLETPLENLCKPLFRYYKALIKNNSDIYRIEPNYFFFNNTRTINAWAQAKANGTIISINIGTINGLKETFLDNDNLTEKIFGSPIHQLSELLKSKNSSVMEFMYNSANIFLINHEIGHLIQKNEESERRLSESIESLGDFKIQKHIFEVDSDVFSAMKLSQDIHQIWKGFDAAYSSDGFLYDLISLALAAIGVFKLFNLNAENDIYYKEKSHPHVAVRFTIIMEVMVDYIFHINDSTPSDDYKDRIMANSLSIIEALNKYHKDSFFHNFARITIDNSEEIEKYSKYLLLAITEEKNSAYCKLKAFK